MVEIDDDTRLKMGKIAETADKLLSETQRLRRDIQRILEVVAPGEDQSPMSRSESYHEKPANMKTLKDALDTIERGRSNIKKAEYDVSYVRGRMEQILESAWSRDEWKDWIKKNPN